MNHPIHHFAGGFLAVIIVLGVWEVIWKGIALWRSAQHRQKAWFVVILIINSAGILPIVYLIWFQRPKVAQKD